MRNLQNDPIHMNAHRRRNESRIKRERKKNRIAKFAKSIVVMKISILWFLCGVAILTFIIAMESVLQYRIILKWALIFTFMCVLIHQVNEVTREIKKSPRNGNSKRDTEK